MAKMKFILPTEEPSKTSTKEIKSKHKFWIKLLASISIVELLIIFSLLWINFHK